ncbi:MAG: RHS repeat-associated core domain-containing protein [Blastocatellales bacterium]|nr:RHS repeat-associated core domain-containing protein [Blastocatellales bacterium]
MRLEAAASVVGLEGQTVSGMAFTLYDGGATWDRAGKIAQSGGAINNRPFNVDEARNRLLPMSGVMEYDAAGNLSKDSYTTPWLGTRVHDAENRMVSVNDDGEDLQSSYQYDGDGRRARRILSGLETWQIYGMGGELLAEYAAGGAVNAPQKEYGYRGGQLLIVAESGGTVKWLVGDQLGTPRMVVDSSGELTGANGVVRHDYLPFGEEIGGGIGIRGSSSGYGMDTVRQKYTGYERDGETGLDFAQARYFASAQGRFTSPDPLLESGKIAIPQSWNRYAYTLNRPLTLIDPTGLEAEVTSGIEDEEQRRRQANTPPKPGTPAGIKIVVTKQQTLNGEQLTYPNGTKSDESYYGFGIGVNYEIVDSSGNRVNATEIKGFTLSEEVVVSSYTPEAAKPLAEGIKTAENAVPAGSDGKFYDQIGPLFETRGEHGRFARQPEFKANYVQTLTLKNTKGEVVATSTNNITITKYKVEVTTARAKTP